MNIAYLRVSTDQQDVISQEVAIKEFTNKHHIVIDEWIKDEGVSGFKISIEKRESLNYIKSLALDGKLETLIVFASDRIIRQTEGSLYLKLLASNGVKILSVTEGELFKNEDIDELLTFIRFFNSNQESKKISNRICAGKKASTLEGKYGAVVPYGYKLVNHKLQIVEEEAEVIKEIFNLYISVGTNKTLEYLNKNNITKRGRKWSSVMLNKILRNPIFKGCRNSKYDIGYNSDLQIIPTDIFEHVQQLIESRKCKGITSHTNKSTSEDSLLEGLFFHEYKGELHKLTIDYNNRPNGKQLVYKCSKCKRDKVKDIKKSYGGKKFNRIVESEVKKVLKNLSTEELESTYCKKKALSLHQIQSEIDMLNITLDKKKLALTNGNNMLEKAFMGELDADVSVLSNKIKQIQNDIVQLELYIKELDTELHKKEIENMNKNRLISKYKDFDYLYSVATIQQKKSILQELIEKVVINEKDDVNIILNI